MPQGLVLVVNLVRALVRGVVFAVRHPIATATVAGLGWLGWLTYAFGWRLVAVLAGCLAWVLVCWAAIAWPSFVRLVGRPARARWRHVFIYRRHWQPVMVMSGLAFYRNAREHLPVIRRVRVDATTDRVLVKMLSGQAPGIWRNHADNLAHGFGAALCRVRTAERPGHVWLELVRRDALAVPIPALPVPATEHDVDLTALPVGRREDASPWLLRLLGTHLLIAGATGAGKGSVLWSIVRAMLPAIRAGLVQVWGLDPKRMELAFGRGSFTRYSDDATGGMVELLDAAVAEMHKRAARFGGVTPHVPAHGGGSVHRDHG